MPLFYTHNINEDSRLAVWYINEEERFFRKYVTPQREVTHPHKRVQHLAGRYLLKILEPGFPVDKILLDGRRPYLQGNTFHFSISHCGNYAAAIVSRREAVGIDVEISTKKIIGLENKFVSDTERSIIEQSGIGSLQKGLTAVWSTKESLFKWYALGNVNFKLDLEIRSIEFFQNEIHICTFFHKEVQTDLLIHARYFDDLCLTWVAK